MIVNKRQKCIKCGKKGFFSVKLLASLNLKRILHQRG